MLGCLEITLNCTMWSQTKACTAKLSCEFSTLLRYYAVLNGNSLQPISPIIKGK